MTAMIALGWAPAHQEPIDSHPPPPTPPHWSSYQWRALLEAMPEGGGATLSFLSGYGDR